MQKELWAESCIRPGLPGAVRSKVDLASIVGGKEVPRVYVENRLLDFIKRITTQRVKDSFSPLGG